MRGDVNVTSIRNDIRDFLCIRRITLSFSHNASPPHLTVSPWLYQAIGITVSNAYRLQLSWQWLSAALARADTYFCPLRLFHANTDENWYEEQYSV